MAKKPVTTADLVDFFALVEKVFPIKEAGMPADFKGAHNLTPSTGGVKLTVWWKGQAWPVVMLTTLSNDRLLGQSDLESIKAEIEDVSQQTGEKKP